MIESHSLSEHLFRLAAEAANQGKNRKALEYLEQVLIMNPKHAMAWCLKRNCLDKLGWRLEALRSCNAAI